MGTCLKFTSIRGDLNYCTLYIITSRNAINFKHLFRCDTIECCLLNLNQKIAKSIMNLSNSWLGKPLKLSKSCIPFKNADVSKILNFSVLIKR